LLALSEEALVYFLKVTPQESQPSLPFRKGTLCPLQNPSLLPWVLVQRHSSGMWPFLPVDLKLYPFL
jgi:hypothetical protein